MITNVTYSNIQFCIFNDNYADRGGAILVHNSHYPKIEFCTFSQGTAARHEGGAIIIQDTRNTCIINMCVFTKNKADVGGAVHINSHFRIEYNGKIYINDCHFSNNSAATLGHSIYNNGNLHLRNIYITSLGKSNVYHIHSEIGRLALQNITLDMLHSGAVQDNTLRNGIFATSSDLYTSNGLLLFCPTNFNVRVLNNSYLDASRAIIYTLFIAYCQSCSRGTYSLFNGELYLSELSARPSIRKVNCSQCPCGGICNGDIKAASNFWGYKSSSNQITLLPCPSGYCCTSETTTCQTYNTCRKGSHGVLCGSCKSNYRQSFLSDGCILKSGRCDYNVFITYFFVYSFLYTILFMYMTSVMELVKKFLPLIKEKCVVCKKKSRSDDEKDIEYHEPLIREQNKSEIHKEHQSDEENLSIPALLQIIIHFYQIASLLHLKFQGGKKKVSFTNELRNSISNIFNFRFVIYQEVCPLDDLNLPLKELINFGLKLSSFVNLVAFYAIVRTFHFLRNTLHSESGSRMNDLVLPVADYDQEADDILITPCQSDNVVGEENTGNMTIHQMPESHINVTEEGDVRFIQSSATNQKYEKLCFTTRLQLCFIKLLKLHYTPITTLSFQMVYCVTILGKQHLYVYGDQICYAWWQFIIFVLIIPGVLIFPLSFGFSMYLIRTKQISSTTFLLAAGVPYYAVWLYVKTIFYGHVLGCYSKEEEARINKMLEVEENAFKQSNHIVTWQVVQFYRSLSIAILKTCIINPIYRSITFLPVLVAFLVQDRSVMPFKHPYLNTLQTLSSTCLLLILGCNQVSSFSYMTNIIDIPYMDMVVKSLTYTEGLLYLVIPLSLPLWKLWVRITRRQRRHKED